METWNKQGTFVGEVKEHKKMFVQEKNLQCREVRLFVFFHFGAWKSEKMLLAAAVFDSS